MAVRAGSFNDNYPVTAQGSYIPRTKVYFLTPGETWPAQNVKEGCVV